jgi:hypothetical protein
VMCHLRCDVVLEADGPLQHGALVAANGVVRRL